ncbi:MAG: dephospho-CoA kinase [Verrucomicrobia bacterium]|nr:dephospho-CoA kinase [Verrucomicrobiota bacterium]
MKIFGLTGGIGMGKSTAAQLLARRGFAVVDTDVLARQVVEPGQPALLDLAAEFGRGIIGQDGRLLREKLAEVVFADEPARLRLEAIVHPRIRAAWMRQLEDWRQQRKPLAVVVIPLLFETDAKPHFDATICVACSVKTQLARLKPRGWTAEQIEKRRLAQWPIERKMALSDYVVWTEGSLEVHAEQLNRIVAV